jgi:hypothetical protein
MKISIAIVAAMAVSSAGLYGTGVIGGGAYDNMFEAQLNGDAGSDVEYPVALEDVFTKLISTPVIDEANREFGNNFAPQIIISARSDRQITWKVNFQSEHIATVVIDLTPVSAGSTRANLTVNVANNSILLAASSASDTDVQELEKLSRLMIAILIDYRLTGKRADAAMVKAALYDYPNAKDLEAKLMAIDRVARLRFGSSIPEPEIPEYLEMEDGENYDMSPASATEPTDSTIGEATEELYQDHDASGNSAAVERAIERAERDAERASEQAAEAAERAGAAAERAAMQAQYAARRAAN